MQSAKDDPFTTYLKDEFAYNEMMLRHDISAAKTKNRAGIRRFECYNCGWFYEIPTRDRFSPSGETCPQCREADNPPISSRPDENIKVDKWGNLI